MDNSLPMSMMEVKEQVAIAAVHGHPTTEQAIIEAALVYSAQEDIDEALEGHYDTVALVDGTLEFRDLDHEIIGNFLAQASSLIADFEKDAPALYERLTKFSQKMAGSR